eukprot:6486140-Amphidinium_carterae.1
MLSIAFIPFPALYLSWILSRVENYSKSVGTPTPPCTANECTVICNVMACPTQTDKRPKSLGDFSEAFSWSANLGRLVFALLALECLHEAKDFTH